MSATQVLEDVYVCDDCGAHAENSASIKHHKTCKPGEAQYWENFYTEEARLQEAIDDFTKFEDEYENEGC